MFCADNLLYASLMIFEIITLEGWSDMMYTVRRANNGEFTFDFFFTLVVVTGAFFVLNLMTAVQFNYFERTSEMTKKVIIVVVEHNGVTYLPGEK